MQFTLQSLMIAFIVVASAIGVFGPWGIAVALACILAAACIQKSKSTDKAGLAAGLILVVALILYFAIRPHTAKPETDQCLNNLKQIASAIRDYEKKNGSLPPEYLAGPDGKPWHSWRVLILPFLDRKDLFDAYDFKEPWNGPKNIKLSDKMPGVFHCPSDKNSNARSQASYFAVVGSETFWRGAKPVGALGFWSRQTVMLVEKANSGINWLEPRDLSYQQVCKDNPSTDPDLFAPHKRKGGLRFKWAGWSNVAFADGNAKSVSSNFLSENFKTLLTGDSDWVSIDQDKGPLYDPNYIDLPSFSDWSKIINVMVFVVSLSALAFRPRRRKKRANVKEDED
jgi:prepilin-type processing-associated H-X9-DG protein